MKILVIDDYPDYTKLITRHLCRAGFSGEAIDTALSLNEARQLLSGALYDLIISDLNVEGDPVGAIELLRRVRSVLSPRTAIIIISAYPGILSRYRMDIDDIGVSGILRKGGLDGKFFPDLVHLVLNTLGVEREDKPQGAVILHLSDLHFGDANGGSVQYQPLVSDLRGFPDGLGVDHIDSIVVSGDFTNNAKPEEFRNAAAFIKKLAEEFGTERKCLYLVPGNHDVSWETRVYDWVSQRLFDPATMDRQLYSREGRVFLVRELEKYPDRFRDFGEHLYKPLVDTDYPLDPCLQATPKYLQDFGIQFLLLNSAWQTDEFFPKRHEIHEGALTEGLRLLDDQIGADRHVAQDVLRIAVLHHPVVASEMVSPDAYLEQLRKALFRVMLHGHLHEERSDLIYSHLQGIHIVGAGSFGAPVNERPESTPRLYNLLEVSSDRRKIKVNTRRRRKKGGAWEGYAEWPVPGEDEPGLRRPYYYIDLEDR